MSHKETEISNLNEQIQIKNYSSLRLALIVYVVVPLAIAMGATSYFALDALEKHSEERMQKDLELVARAIRLPISYALEREREGSISRTLESAFSIGRVYSAYVYDQKGKQIAAVGRKEKLPRKNKLTRLAEAREETGEYGNIAGRNVYSYFVPLIDSGGRVSGLLHLTRRERDLRQYIHTIRTNGIIWFVLSLVTMMLLVLWGHHNAMGKHFSMLIRSINKVTEGDEKHRFAPAGPKEITAIGSHFNLMLDSIQKTQLELFKKNEKQKLLRAQLKQAEKLAAIGQLGAGVAHELGTPLSVIAGQAQRGLRDKNLSPKIKTILQEIRHEVLRMEHIIRQLLVFSHSSELRKRRTKPSVMAHSSANAITEEADLKNVRVEIATGNSDPEIEVDPIKIEQVLTNLLRNAIQSENASQTKISWHCKNKEICFQIDDDGAGIDEEIKDRIFEPFFTTKEVGTGTGLGLAVVHGIIKEHGGTVNLGKSKLGGTFFKITLPTTGVKQIGNN
ncbi:MAG: ATP-binding protein [Candidatus Rifleibacteriota bacterium]